MLQCLSAFIVYDVPPLKGAWFDRVFGQAVCQILVLNADNLTRCELFVGHGGAEDGEVEVLTHPDKCPVARGRAHRAEGSGWVGFDLTTTRPDSVIRGHKYEFRFTGSSGKLGYYYQEDNPYRRGVLQVGGQELAGRDLCFRVFGQAKPVDKTYFGAYPYFPMGSETWGCSMSTWKKRAGEAGLRHVRYRVAWTWVDSVPYGRWQYAMPDTQYLYFRDSLDGCDVYGNLYSCTQATSTHYDGETSSWSVDAPPCSLFLPADSPNNYWGRFVESMVMHYDSLSNALGCESIHVYEIWNEPNVLKDYWRPPNARDYRGIASVRARCSLYVRLCKVAHSVITGLAGHERDQVLVGSVGELENEQFGPGGDTLILKGKVWLRWMYEIAGREYGGPFWDGVAFHYYDDPGLSTFEANAETLRGIMWEENRDYGELWVTEVGWPSPDMLSEDEQANAVTGVFVTAVASASQDGGGYDRVNWFSLRDAPQFGHGLADTLFGSLKRSFHAFVQVGRLLSGKRSNGRVMLRDGRDSLARIYEFCDTAGVGGRMWVAWRVRRPGHRNDEPPPVGARVPVRTDAVEWEYCAYREDESRNRANVAPSGWFAVSLESRPVFIFESARGGFVRPDLAVDSVRVEPSEPRVGEGMVIRAWVRNKASKETRATPKGMATRVLFVWEGDTLGSETTAAQIGTGKTHLFEFRVDEVGQEMAGPALVKVVANPEQQYVELDMTNNAGYVAVETR